MLCKSFDGIKALTVGEAPEPHPAPDEVLVDVHAASVSYMDYLMICGGYQMRPSLPYVPGTDAAGVVAACGEKVKRFRPGDRVACENWFGGFAERMTAKASKTARLPDNTDFIVGSTLLHIYLTAWYALVDRARHPDRRIKLPAATACRSHARARPLQGKHQLANSGTAAPPRSATKKRSQRSPSSRLITEKPAQLRIFASAHLGTFDPALTHAAASDFGSVNCHVGFSGGKRKGAALANPELRIVRGFFVK